MSSQPDITPHVGDADRKQSNIELFGATPQAGGDGYARGGSAKGGPVDGHVRCGSEPPNDDNDATGQAPVGPIRAASVVAGSLCLMIPTFGLMSAWGLFQVYWQENQLAGCSLTDVSWIGSMFGFLTCLLGVLWGLTFDRSGPRVVKWMLGSSCLGYYLCLLALAWCGTYAQLMGVITMAGSFVSIPTMLGICVIGDWFADHHSTATGIVSSGAPIGGILFSLVLRALFRAYDWKTSMYFLSTIVGIFLALGFLLVDSRHKPKVGPSLDLRCLKSVKFAMMTFCVFVFEFVLFTQLGSLPVFAATSALGDIFYLQTIYNAGAIVGRSVPSLMAVRTGPINMLAAMTILSIFAAFVIWIPFGSTNTVALYVVAVLMGVGTGAFVPLGATCLSHLSGGRDYGTWLGSCYTLVSFATLIGNPVNQAILEKAGPRSSVGFQGSLLVLALATLMWLRWLYLERQWSWSAKA